MSESASSGHGLKFSRWACRLTIRAMLMPRRVPWDAPDCLYLHTLTFKDPEPSYKEGRARWNSFATNFLNGPDSEWFGVCVPQWGEITKRLHFHLVTTIRPDAKEWWAAVDAYGFGRYDVRKRPSWRIKPCIGMPSGKIHEAAWYAARYVARRDYWPEELRGGRSWSVFGRKRFPHPPCAVRDVRITGKSLTVIPESPKPFGGYMEWRFAGDSRAFRFALRPDSRPGDIVQMREITPEQQKKVNTLMASGAIVGIGEYRFCGIEVKEMAQYVGGVKSNNKERRVVVTHKVDFGATCERREFDELLPVGADEKTFAPPAKSGETVAVSIAGMTAYKGGTNWKGEVVKL